jgi:SAM-dependent methyltransferase
MKQHQHNTYRDLWDNRYKEEHYAYGKAPNAFFAEWLRKFEPGTILMPADGEGRNGVFAATLNWKVTSFDWSEEGRRKALRLASEQQVHLDYLVADLTELDLKENTFNAIGLIYAHFTADKKSFFHQQLARSLQPGGVVIFEAFSKQHTHLRAANPQAGGAMDQDMLFSAVELKADFAGFKILLLEEAEVLLSEGTCHAGKGAVVRFVGTKPLQQPVTK